MSPTQPAQVTDPDTGSRYYTIRDQQYWSVTTALSVINKDNLPYWAAGLAATGAFEQLPQVLTAARVKPCGNTYTQCRAGRGPRAHDWRLRCETCPCDRCRDCVRHQLVQRHVKVRDTRADEGRRTHDVIEQWVLTGGKIAPHDDDIKSYVAAFLGFTDDYGLTPDSWHFAEATLANHTERYAGTTDGVILFQCNTDPATNLVAKLHQLPVAECVERGLRASVVVDFKTKEKTIADRGSWYPELALQLVGYRRAEAVIIGGEEELMPPTMGAMGVQLRLDGAVPRLCVTDETSYAAFLCALNLYRWHVEAGTASVSERSFKVPAAAKKARATKKAGAQTLPYDPACYVCQLGDPCTGHQTAEEFHSIANSEAPVAAKAVEPAATRTPRKTAAKKTPPSNVAAKSAVLASLDRLAAPASPARPDSPHGDNIPF